MVIVPSTVHLPLNVASGALDISVVCTLVYHSARVVVSDCVDPSTTDNTSDRDRQSLDAHILIVRLFRSSQSVPSLFWVGSE